MIQGIKRGLFFTIGPWYVLQLELYAITWVGNQKAMDSSGSLVKLKQAKPFKKWTARQWTAEASEWVMPTKRSNDVYFTQHNSDFSLIFYWILSKYYDLEGLIYSDFPYIHKNFNYRMKFVCFYAETIETSICNILE